MVRVPAVTKVSEQPPAPTAAEHDSPVLAFTVAVPVGEATLVEPVTLTLIITGLFGFAGFGKIEVMVVVVVARLTVRETLLEALV